MEPLHRVSGYVPIVRNRGGSPATMAKATICSGAQWQNSDIKTNSIFKKETQKHFLLFFFFFCFFSSSCKYFLFSFFCWFVTFLTFNSALCVALQRLHFWTRRSYVGYCVRRCQFVIELIIAMLGCIASIFPRFDRLLSVDSFSSISKVPCSSFLASSHAPFFVLLLYSLVLLTIYSTPSCLQSHGSKETSVAMPSFLAEGRLCV